MLRTMKITALSVLVLLVSANTWAADKDKKEDKDKAKSKGKQMFAIMETSMGTFKVKLFNEESPKTVENFVDLAEGKKKNPDTGKLIDKKFYDGTIFHRVIPNFMLQGGDPDGRGTGGPGYKIKDEFNAKLKHSKPGILSMANAGPDTGGSQFFVTVAATPWLDQKHAIFGEVVEGYDIVEKISKTPTAPGDKPKTDVVLKSVKIERK